MLRLTRIGAVLLFLAAAVGTLVAAGSYHVLCLDGTHSSCPEDQGPGRELVWQLVLAVLGVAAATVMLFMTWRGRYRAAGLLLVVALLLYAGWALLLDVATHGGDLTLV